MHLPEIIKKNPWSSQAAWRPEEGFQLHCRGCRLAECLLAFEGKCYSGPQLFGWGWSELWNVIYFTKKTCWFKCWSHLRSIFTRAEFDQISGSDGVLILIFHCREQECGSVVHHLPGMHEALDLIPHTAKQKRENFRLHRECWVHLEPTLSHFMPPLTHFSYLCFFT